MPVTAARKVSQLMMTESGIATNAIMISVQSVWNDFCVFEDILEKSLT